jgi:exopolysaccharide production protein ExoZ
MLSNVQALRALAAFAVAIGHLQPLAMQIHPALGWVGLGRAGVDLFFVISGFIMVYTTERQPLNATTFAIRRIIRIVPLYWAVTLAVFALAIVAPGLLGATQANPEWLVKSLLFVPFDKGDGTFNPVVAVGWTLNYEMFFYAIFALSLLLPLKRAKYLIVIATILAFSLPGFWMDFEGVAAQFYTRPILAEFAIGMVIALLFDRLPAVTSTAMAWVVRVLGAAAFVALFASGIFNSEGLRVLVAGLSATTLVALMLMLERGGRGTKSKSLLVLGDASYAIYLTHLFVTQAFIIAAARLGIQDPGGSALMMIAALAAVAAVGVATWFLFEKPAGRLLRRAAGRPKAKATLA